VPIIFRPFHEHNGKAFWWSKYVYKSITKEPKGNRVPDEFTHVWQFTVEYLRDVKGDPR